MMFRILFIALMAFSLQGEVFAQASNSKKGGPKNQGKKPSPEVMAAKQAANLQKQLGLTEEQKSDVEKAALSRITKMEAIKEKYKGAGSENRERGSDMRLVRQEYVNAVNKILTPTQQSTWKKLREEKKAKKNAGKGKGKGKGQTGNVPASDIDPNEDVDEI